MRCGVVRLRWSCKSREFRSDLRSQNTPTGVLSLSRGILVNIGLKCNTLGYEKELQGWEQKKLPYATATALTRTAKRVQTAFIAAMQSKFDRPTPYVLGGTFVKPATASVLTATVGWKNFASKAVPASVFMLPQVQGGSRNLKSTEKMLNRAGFLPGGMITVPGARAKLDAYGNMTRGQLVQVISALQAFPETGYNANRNVLKARAKAAKGTRLPDFFVGAPAGGRLPLGVYQRMRDHTIRPILIFVKSPNYKILIPFAALADQVYTADFQEEFNRAMRDMTILTPFLEAA
jgi:hypothetical protein